MTMKRLVSGLCLAAVMASAGHAGAKEDKKGRGVNLFMGNYGYVLEYPAGYTALPSFDDPEKTMERVLIYPKGTPAAEMDEASYGRRGIVRLETAPIIVRTPRGTFRAGLKELRAIIPESLKERGEKCVVEDFPAALPGAKFTISGGIPVVQVILEGAKVTYIFTSAKDDARLRKMIKSLKEISPTDRPGI
jgi:hypothetical protein